MYKNFDLANLEREYSPSSCINDINIYIDKYILQSKVALEKAKREQALEADLHYGKSQDELIDLYLPTQGNTKKLHIYIHGGYWQALSKNESSFAASNFQQKGCYFAAINYSLAPNANLTEIVEQNRKAIAWLYSHATQLGFDADEIYISGSSAGAHLAMMMLQTNWSDYIQCDKIKNNQLIKGVCAVSGIYDLIPIALTYINDTLKLTPLEIEQNSPNNKTLVNNCPIIFAFGEQETSEFKRQTSEILMVLGRAGIEVSCKEIHNRNHFDVILDLADSNSWLSNQVFRQMNL
ncbi:hypothetical protein CJF42_13815 [Pseudoalteromonas sp. NBT06-2]|uniref:alpha/beta hydrolase n=1 Tax=Pseudoalteromonas sp. NBT06-2 TaxID=2025950 RepID=UPI000BA52B68|nr:alpha/beta hydrolase [Pseudoalteromonas sp. NBT06-2]PAJ73803.1 hypothetical protein CJF42_13815 [Pseudoalteromonas sp. NBT06-2]